MALDVSGSDSLYWKAGIDFSGMPGQATAIVGIIKKLALGVAAVNPFAIIGIAATAGFARAGFAAENFAEDFDREMKKVKTISEIAQRDFQGVSNGIIELSREVPQLANQLARAYYQIESSIDGPADRMEILEAAAKGAVAGVTDTFTVADAATRIMNSYGDSAGNAMNIVDKLFKTVEIGVVEMEELSREIGNVVGLSAKAGVSFDELMAAIAEGSKTIRGSQVTEGIRGILAAIIQNSQESRQAAADIGLEFGAAALNAKGFQAFLADVFEKTQGDITVLNKLFGRVEGLNALLAVFSQNGANYASTLDQMTESAGATERAFAIMMEEKSNQAQLFKNNLLAVLKPMGDAILGATNAVLGGLNDLFESADKSLKDTVTALQSQAGGLRKVAGEYDALRKVKDRTVEQDARLVVLEKQLYAYLGADGVDSMKRLTGQTDLYAAARLRVEDLDKRAIELEIRRATLEQRRIEQEQRLFAVSKDRATKELENARKAQESAERGAIGSAGVSLRPEYMGAGSGTVLGMKEYQEALKKLDLAENAYLGKYTENLAQLRAGYLTSAQAAKLYADIRADILANDQRTQKATLKTIELESNRAILQEELNVKYETARLRIEELNSALLGLNKVQEKITKPSGGDPKEQFDLEKFEDQINTVRTGYEQFFQVVQTAGRENAELLFKELMKNGENYGAFLDDMEQKYRSNDSALRTIAVERAEYVLSRDKALNDARETLGQSAGARRLAIEKSWNEKIIVAESDAERALFENAKQKQLQQFDYDEKLKALKLSRAKYWGEAELGIAIESLKKLQREYEGNDEWVQSLGESISTLIEELNQRREDGMRSSMDSLIKNTEQMTAAELADYREYLKTRLNEFKKNSEEYLRIEEKIADTDAKIWDKQIEKIRSVGDAISQLGSLMGRFNEGLGRSISDIGTIVRDISGIKDAIEGGNTWGAVAGGIGITSTAVGILMDALIKTDDTLERVQASIQKLKFETEEFYESMRRAQGLEIIPSVVATVEREKENIEEYLQALRELKVFGLDKSAPLGSIFGIDEDMVKNLLGLSDKFGAGGQLFVIPKETREAIQALVSQITEAQSKIFDLQKQYQQALTGTTTPAIADSIADGFRQGIGSAEQFANTFEKLMQESIMESFKRTITTQMVNDFYDEFAFLADEGLTASEIQRLAASYKDILAGAENRWKDLESIARAAGINLIDADAKKQGLAGEIKGITENTAGIMAGQMNAIRVNVLDILGASRLSQSGIAGIYENSSKMIDLTGAVTNRLDRLIDLNIDIADTNRDCARYLRNLDTKTAAAAAPVPGPGLSGIGGAY